MKTIAVVATEKAYAEFLKNNVEKYMSRYANFVAYSVSEAESLGVLTEDFVLLSAFNIFQKVRQRISPQTEIIVLSLALSNRQIEVLKEIPEGTRALLVNFDNPSCMHTIHCMYEAGIRNLELYPYFGEGEFDRSIEVAITPNEAHLVPEGIKKVYDVGESAVDMNSLYHIADKLGVYETFSAREANEARKEYFYINSSMDKLLNEKESMEEKLNAMLRLMKDGIIITDSMGRIYLANDKAAKLMEFRTELLQGFNIEDVIPELDLSSTKEKLIKTPDANLIASAVEIRTKNEVAGHIITITDFEEAEEKQHSMRAKVSGNNLHAKYHFEDILAESPIMSRVVDDSRRIAASDAAVMINGESGTGKEMFAQSIHNASHRRKYNFVAVNCAAIPENLLESEMFGYEEGSFTGAQKGGRAGLFELAHRGTIFLDEIAEMPLQLQSKLLRVLEEKKVMRVGSTRNIDVDVRVIAATNKDLPAMVKSGDFREDLYYRLNVLPISIPPLRERKEDILMIFRSMLKKSNVVLELSPKAEKIMLAHQWQGNVRELRNAAEFVVSKGKRYIEADDLPPMLLKKENAEEEAQETDDKADASIIDKFILHEGRDIELHYFVLRALEAAYSQGERCGRQRLLEYIRENGKLYTEGEVRKSLEKLSAYGLILSAKGRGGSVIQKDGLRMLKRLTALQKQGIF